MIHKVKRIVKNPLFSGSLVMIVGSNVGNVINYVYHLIMGRMLGPSAYGELAVLLSLFGILGVAATALNLVVVKYISAAEDEKEIAGLVKWFESNTFRLSLIIFVLIAFISPLAAKFLNVSSFITIILIALAVVISFITTVVRSALQGLLMFTQNVASFLIEHILKLTIGVILVVLGFSVGGAVFALVIATLLSLIVSRKFLSLKPLNSTVPLPVKSVLYYSMPVLFQSIAITSLYSTDLILVKHFFNSQDAGIYAAVSTLGKIIFFTAGPISSVMFPIVSRRHARGEDYQKPLYYSLVATALSAIVVLLLFQFIPQQTLTVLYGTSYLSGAGLLIYFGIFATLFTLSSLLINFHLSLKRSWVVVFPILAAIAQIIGIWSFHFSLLSVIMVSIVVSSGLFVSLFAYTVFKYYLR